VFLVRIVFFNCSLHISYFTEASAELLDKDGNNFHIDGAACELCARSSISRYPSNKKVGRLEKKSKEVTGFKSIVVRTIIEQ